jgi:hypothetical protein
LFKPRTLLPLSLSKQNPLLEVANSLSYRSLFLPAKASGKLFQCPERYRKSRFVIRILYATTSDVNAKQVSDGPNGARGAGFEGGTPAACFPAASSVAATFDVDIAHQIGVALAEETKTKGARCLLGPTTCMHRHPLGGRNFEVRFERLAGTSISCIHTSPLVKFNADNIP